MPTPIAEVRLSVQLDRERALIFNLNTMAAYEEATANTGEPKFYWDTMLALFKFYEDNAAEFTELYPIKEGDGMDKARRRTKLGTAIMRYISARELKALVWACVHEYKHDEPIWPLTVAQVAKFLKPQDTISTVYTIMKGHSSNGPSKAELGEASGDGPSKIVEQPAEAAPKQQEAGGGRLIELPVAAFV